MNKTPIIIDCDPGVDDSYAIALANSCPDFEIVAITAVEGNVSAEITRKNALCLADMLGIDCRVGFGAEKPLVRPYKRDASGTHGQSGVGTVKFPEPKKQPDEKPAWDVIYEEAVKSEGKLILFAIGPLTNIAIALREHPDLPKYISKFCIMGGGTFGNVSATGAKAEFNIWIDPTAAALSAQDFDDMIEICADGDNAYLVRELSKFSKFNSMEKGHDNNIIHDALAIASMINPDVVTYESYYVYVEDDPQAENEGETVIDLKGESGKPANCHVAMKVNQPLFADMLKDMCRHYANK